MSKPLLIAMMGLPRSGKSTITRRLREELGAPVVNRDDIRLALHGKRYESLAEPMVKAISKIMIHALFLSGHRIVIYDETNYSKAARDFIKSDEWTTIFHEVTTGPLTCSNRAEQTNQPDLIPVIWAMFNRYEPLGEDELKWDGQISGIKDFLD